MKKQFILFSSLILFCSSVHAQAPKLWDKRYGGTNWEFIKAIVSRDNGNVIVAGNSWSQNNGDKTVASFGGYDYWIICADSNGNKLWDAAFGGLSDEDLSAVVQTKDHGFLFAGSSGSGIGGTKTQTCQGNRDYWVVKADSAGNYQWDKRFGGSSYDGLTCVCADNDGGYLLAGMSNSSADGDKSQNSWGGFDYWIVKIDSAGVKLWDKRFGGTGDDQCYSVVKTSDHGYILSGYSASGMNGDKSQTSRGGDDYWTLRIDSIGTKIWDKRFGTSSYDDCLSACSDGHDGVVLGGFTDGVVNGDKTQSNWGSFDYWLVHVDSAGNKVWDSRFGGNDSDDTFGNISATSDGGYISTGTSYSGISGNKTQANLGAEQTWMVKCDASGNFISDKTLLTSGHEETGFATATAGNGFIIGNNTDAGIGGDKTQSSQGGLDYFIAKYGIPGVPAAAFTTSDTAVCPGQCITFNDVSGNYPSAWSWSFPGGIPAFSNMQNPTICYDSAGLYDVQLIVTNMSGTDTILQTAYMDVPPQIPATIVQNGAVLTCVPPSGSYQWYLNSTSVFGATDQAYTATQPGSYFVLVSNSFGCTYISQALSFNTNFAVANFSASDTIICQNSCLSFNDLSLNNPSGWSWSFPGAVTSSATQQNPVNICYHVPGIYTVTLTANNQYGQSTAAFINYIHVLANPLTPLISQIGDTLFCISADSNYQWYVNGGIIPGATAAYYVMPVSGNYSVEIKNVAGCSASASYDALLPAPDFGAQDSLLCEKFCTNFIDLSTNNPVGWNWIFEGGTPAASDQQNPNGICYNAPGMYDVTLITYDGVKYDTLLLPDYITVSPTPPLPVIIISGDTLVSTPSFAYQWQWNEVDIAGATNQYYAATQSGVYTVITYSEEGCAAQVSIDVDLTSINSINQENGFEIFPNPSSGIIQIKTKMNEEKMFLKIYDAIGQLKREFHFSGKQTTSLQLDLHDLPAGIYSVQLSNDELQWTKMLVLK